MFSDLRTNSLAAGTDALLIPPHIRRAVILAGLAVIAVLFTVLIALRPSSAAGVNATGTAGDRIGGQGRAQDAPPPHERPVGSAVGIPG
jgi:hypothetical protein